MPKNNKQQKTKDIRTQIGFSCKMIKMQIRLSCTHMTRQFCQNCVFATSGVLLFTVLLPNQTQNSGQFGSINQGHFSFQKVTIILFQKVWQSVTRPPNIQFMGQEPILVYCSYFKSIDTPLTYRNTWPTKNKYCVGGTIRSS